MNRNMSVYLDLLRLLAAFGVFFGHGRHILAPGIPVLIGGHAAQSVSVFFVLSGLVIAFVVDAKEKNWRAYARARVIRMYSVSLVALLITLWTDRLGQTWDGSVYLNSASFRPLGSTSDIVSYLTFTHQIWWQDRWVGSNEAFWSLGYEVPYYLIFGLATFLPKGFRVIAVFIACLVVGPKVIAYFSLWLLGVWYYRRYMREGCAPPGSARLGLALLIVSVALYLVIRFAVPVPIYNMYQWKGWGYAVISWLHFHAVGMCVIINLVGFELFSRARDIWPPKLVSAIRWAAGGSFTLYLVHQPLMFLAAAICPSAKSGLTKGSVAMVVVLVCAYALAELGERRKRLISVWVDRYLIDDTKASKNDT